LEIPGGGVQLVLRLGAGAGGELQGEIDLPAPGSMGIPLSGLSYGDGRLSAAMPNGSELKLRHAARCSRHC
jgi:hypothetical protein